MQVKKGRRREREYPLALRAAIGHLFPDLPPSRIKDLDLSSARVAAAEAILQTLVRSVSQWDRHQPMVKGKRFSYFVGDNRPGAAGAELARLDALRVAESLAVEIAAGSSFKLATARIARTIGRREGQVGGKIATARKIRGDRKLARHKRPGRKLYDLG